MTDDIKNAQNIEIIEDVKILDTVADIKTAGYRLSQVCASKIDEKLEVLYTFEMDSKLQNYKVIIDCKEPTLSSITGVFHPAFIYENEMHDLFGITFRNLELDYGGAFYKLSEKTPWNPQEEKGGEE